MRHADTCSDDVLEDYCSIAGVDRGWIASHPSSCYAHLWRRGGMVEGLQEAMEQECLDWAIGRTPCDPHTDNATLCTRGHPDWKTIARPSLNESCTAVSWRRGLGDELEYDEMVQFCQSTGNRGLQSSFPDRRQGYVEAFAGWCWFVNGNDQDFHVHAHDLVFNKQISAACESRTYKLMPGGNPYFVRAGYTYENPHRTAMTHELWSFSNGRETQVHIKGYMDGWMRLSHLRAVGNSNDKCVVVDRSDGWYDVRGTAECIVDVWVKPPSLPSTSNNPFPPAWTPTGCNAM